MTTALLAAVCLFCTWYLPYGGLWNVLCRGMLGFGFVYLGNVFKERLNDDPCRPAALYGRLAAAVAVTAVCAGIGFRFYTNDFFLCRVENPVLFAISGLSGPYVVLGIARMIRSHWLQWFGENSLIVMGTHQLVLYTIPGNASFLWVLGVFVLILAIEIPVILCCNRFCPFLVGKTKRN